MNRIVQGGLGLMVLTAAGLFSQTITAITETQICGPREDVVSQLGMQFAETQKAIGLLGDDAVMEVFVSDHGSWTILTTDVNGMSCLLAAGEAWDDTAITTVGQGV
jgi:hypothetical protein